nr:MAG TPA: hypothetical protein [Caudoviricetes sp.]
MTTVGRPVTLSIKIYSKTITLNIPQISLNIK